MTKTKASGHRPVAPELARAVASAVRDLRVQADLTQEQLAAASEVSVQMIRRLESATSNPTLGTLSSITEAMGVPLPDFFWNLDH